MDLTKNMIPHGLLREHFPEVAAAMEAHGGPWELWGYGEWFEMDSPTFQLNVVYRVKPQPPTKPSIDWSHVAKEYKWLARDGSFSEIGGLYVAKPQPNETWKQWDTPGLTGSMANAFASYTPGTCDWRDSLVQRPEDV